MHRNPHEYWVCGVIQHGLDKLSQATKRSKSFLAAEAIERYLEVEAWQIKKIEQTIKEADAGDFVSEAEFAKIVKKYAG